MDLLVVVAVLAAIGGLYLLAKEAGWKLPPWAYAVAGGAVALLGFFRGRKVVAPPPPVSPEPVRKVAEEVLTERAAADQAKIDKALKSDTPEQDLADLANTRKR